MKKTCDQVLQGSVITQTVLGELTVQFLIANFLQFIYVPKLWKLVDNR